MRAHPLDDGAREGAASCDEHAVEAVALAVPALDDRADQRPARDYEQHREDHEDGEGRAGVEDVGVAGADPEENAGEDDRRDDRSDRDADPLLRPSARRSHPVQTLDGESEREDDRDDRHQLEICGELLLPFRHRDDLEAKAEDPREEDRERRCDRIVDEVDRRKRAVLLFDHGPSVTRRSSARNSSSKRARENVAACARIAARSQPRASASATALPSASTVASLKKIPVVPSVTESSTPPSPYATTGVPSAIASSGVIPKSSTPGRIRLRARERRSMILAFDTKPSSSTLGDRLAANLSKSGPLPMTTSFFPKRSNVSIARSTRLYGTSAETMTCSSARSSSSGASRKSSSTKGCT